jgi:hypothetical protein
MNHGFACVEDQTASARKDPRFAIFCAKTTQRWPRRQRSPAKMYFYPFRQLKICFATVDKGK